MLDDRLPHHVIHLFIYLISIYFKPALCQAGARHWVCERSQSIVENHGAPDIGDCGRHLSM